MLSRGYNLHATVEANCYGLKTFQYLLLSMSVDDLSNQLLLLCRRCLSLFHRLLRSVRKPGQNLAGAPLPLQLPAELHQWLPGCWGGSEPVLSL